MILTNSIKDNFSRRMIVVIISLAVVLVAMMLIIANQVFATSSESRPNSKHVLTVHDGNLKRGVLTSKHNLREALIDAGIKIGAHDITEPALDDQLVDRIYDVTIYRARPVAVVDSGKGVVKIMSPYRTAKQILKQANIKLVDEDNALLKKSDNFIQSGAVEEVVIDRATKFKLDFFGKVADTYSQSMTVGQMLDSKNIELSKDDRISPSVDAVLTEGMLVEIWHEGRQAVVKNEKVKFKIRQIKDSSKKIGYKKIEQKGVEGEQLVTYEVVIKNKKEASRKEIKRVTTKQPKEQIEVVGTKQNIVKYTGGGNKEEWLTKAGIPRDKWGYADSIVTRESGWNPNATNRSSGACGLAQALPCSKVPGNGYNPVDSLRWMNRYVNSRYGGWQGAYNFWQANHWY
ncbi:hypothetical protein CR956_00375 [Candidatus Saccharibacteria bacterium]|nr:MAG: hypothetical protein CR956_00375 [Candidatus Saccharibacteria bacterium]